MWYIASSPWAWAKLLLEFRRMKIHIFPPRGLSASVTDLTPLPLTMLNSWTILKAPSGRSQLATWKQGSLFEWALDAAVQGKDCFLCCTRCFFCFHLIVFQASFSSFPPHLHLTPNQKHGSRVGQETSNLEQCLTSCKESCKVRVFGSILGHLVPLDCLVCPGPGWGTFFLPSSLKCQNQLPLLCAHLSSGVCRETWSSASCPQEVDPEASRFDWKKQPCRVDQEGLLRLHQNR